MIFYYHGLNSGLLLILFLVEMGQMQAKGYESCTNTTVHIHIDAFFVIAYTACIKFQFWKASSRWDVGDREELWVQNHKTRLFTDQHCK